MPALECVALVPHRLFLVRMRNTHKILGEHNFAARFLDLKPERFGSDQQQSTAFDGVVRTYDKAEEEEVVSEYELQQCTSKPEIIRVSCTRFRRT